MVTQFASFREVVVYNNQLIYNLPPPFVGTILFRYALNSFHLNK